MKRSLAVPIGAAVFLLTLLLFTWAGGFSAAGPRETGPAIAATPLPVKYLPAMFRNVPTPPTPTPALPDLYGWGWYYGSCDPGQEGYIRITVYNSGPVPAGPFIVRAGDYWAWDIPGLEAGQSVATEAWVWGAAIDADDQVVESNENNNQIGVPIPTPCPSDPPPPLEPSPTPPCRGPEGCVGPSITPTPSPSPPPLP
jgi:hypothetical protein